MADPAEAAAQRVLDELFEQGLIARALHRPTESVALAAAREALAPLRELHRPYEPPGTSRSPYDVVCNHCLGPRKWPCATAKLIYPSEELT